MSEVGLFDWADYQLIVLEEMNRDVIYYYFEDENADNVISEIENGDYLAGIIRTDFTAGAKLFERDVRFLTGWNPVVSWDSFGKRHLLREKNERRINELYGG